ncbi:hypothetical protein KDL01_17295 [Actinospica durhamensis]|uniref:Thiamine pyrophosphate enzyme TPP-binding domain-containing protein n=1 Tax=Actinospica durhamensis TaxID=1508375 RepID=A0A941IPE2_9ACTN|nr:thiamine pyrophosphate-dependent enzyme [Actinospica durhamensis]MBR7835034.1 hypothetical protein [Actinospica durhamensis]
MDKTRAIAEALAALPTVPTIFTTGYTSRIGAGLGERPNHFYMTGSMGLALSLGAGLALATGEMTLVLDGDGSVLMNPGGMLCLDAAGGLPLIHLVLDDGAYASTGGQRTNAGGVDLCGWAEAAGCRRTYTVGDPQALRDLLRAEAGAPSVPPVASSPVFIRCLVEPDRAPAPPRVDDRLAEHARRFTEYVSARRSAGSRPTRSAHPEVSTYD